MRHSLKAKLAMLSAIGAVALAGIYIFWPSSIADDWPTEPFNGERWRSVAKNERYRMAKDLLSSNQLVGKTREEVEQLLGPPTIRREPYWLYTVQDVGSGVGGFNVVAQIRLAFRKDHRVNKVDAVAD
jgi:hypothetical protein